MILCVVMLWLHYGVIWFYHSLKFCCCHTLIHHSYAAHKSHSCTFTGWVRHPSRGLYCPAPAFPCFVVTVSSAAIRVTARRLISSKVLGRLLIKESSNGPDKNPRTKAWTIRASSWVLSSTTKTPNQSRKSFKGSSCLCFTSNRSKGTGGGAWLTINCSLKNVENWSNEVM